VGNWALETRRNKQQKGTGKRKGQLKKASGHGKLAETTHRGGSKQETTAEAIGY
jgi:hypothetical protein